MPRELRWAKDGPSQRAPETSVQRGNFSPKRKTGCPGRAFLVTSLAFERSDSPEGAKPNTSEHANAALNTNSKHRGHGVRLQIGSPRSGPCPQCFCLGLSVSAPLRRTRERLVSPPRASPFCQPPQKEPKSLAPAIRLFASRKVPSVLRSSRGPRRRAIPGPLPLS